MAIDFPRGFRFPCPDCGAADQPVHDTETRRWRHLNFFQLTCELKARKPRVRCATCGVKTVSVPWARPGNGFTLLFEAFVLTLMQDMPMRAVSELVGEWDTRLWRVLDHYVTTARNARSLESVTILGIDETAARRGHHYVTLAVDAETGAVIFATPGKDAATVTALAEDFATHHGNRGTVTDVTMDMSLAFVKGVTPPLAPRRDHLR